MKTAYFRNSIAILGLFAVLVLLAACGGDSAAPEATAEPATEAAPTVAPTEAAAAEQETSTEGSAVGDTTRFVQLFVDPPTLDPHITTDATSARIIVEVFGGLVTIDPNLDIVPDLAESWDISGDGRVYTFTCALMPCSTTAVRSRPRMCSGRWSGPPIRSPSRRWPTSTWATLSALRRSWPATPFPFGRQRH